MLDAGELDELRTLQARAYGREGGLSDAEAARLDDLEQRRVTPPASAPPATEVSRLAVPAPVDAASSAPSVEETCTERWSADLVEAALAPPAAGVEPRRTLSRTAWRPLALVVVAAFIAGFGGGWLLFGRPADSTVALSPEQQGWHDALTAGGDYDAGSLRAVAVEKGVVIWTATKEQNARTCLILGDGDTTMPNCRPSDEVADQGLWGSFTLESDVGAHREVGAQLLLTASGEPAVVTMFSEYDDSSNGIVYATEEETRIAERLAGEGFDPGTIWVAGYDEEVPIWSASVLESQERCLIYDGSTEPIEMVCAEPDASAEPGEALVLERFDEEGVRTRIQMPGGTASSYLVITRDGGVSGASEQ